MYLNSAMLVFCLDLKAKICGQDLECCIPGLGFSLVHHGCGLGLVAVLGLKPKPCPLKIGRLRFHQKCILFNCLVVVKLNICCTVCKFAFGNGDIRPPILALFGLGCKSMDLRKKYVSMAFALALIAVSLNLAMI